MTTQPPPLLLGSGPSIVPERVLSALARPTIGHMDPDFVALMNDTAQMLRDTFGTSNHATLPVSGTGSAGMDSMVTNFVRPGDRVVVGVNGLFGERMSDAVRRAGAAAVRVEQEWGRAIDQQRLIEAAREPFDALYVTHGETSTGVCQPLEGLAEACAAHDALFLVDCVTTLSGQALSVDEAGIDVAFSGTQKCLNCPPGLAPLTAGERALRRLTSDAGGRAPSSERGAGRPAEVTLCRSWYFDLSLVLGYWTDGDAPRVYHHTAPVNMIYALNEALKIVQEEGLEARWARHARAHQALRSALGALGLEPLVREGEQLNPLLAVRVPEGADDAAVRGALLRDHRIEIAGSLGPLAGRVWRVGVMGEGARPEPQERLVRALSIELGADPADALAALAEGWA